MPLIGAIAGDILGSRYEFANFRGSPEELVIFPPGAFPTDDTVLTCAVAKGSLMPARPKARLTMRTSKVLLPPRSESLRATMEAPATARASCAGC